MFDAVNLACVRDERALFSGLSFSVSPGEMVQVAGKNGAGKTSLLRLLAGLAYPETGEVRWQGKKIMHIRETFHHDLLWLGHRSGIKAVLTAVENIRFFHADRSFSQCFRALEYAGLAGFEDIPVNQLSAGQQRRVALARLWLSSAKLWILDEPFTAIDTNGVKSLTRQMLMHCKAGGMVIFTTHQPLPQVEAFVRQIVLQEKLL